MKLCLILALVSCFIASSLAGGNLWCDPVNVPTNGMPFVNPDWWIPNYVFKATAGSSYQIKIYPTGPSYSQFAQTELYVMYQSGCPTDQINDASFVNSGESPILTATFTSPNSTVSFLVKSSRSDYAIFVCNGNCGKAICGDDTCSGNGFCDVITGNCVCNEGFVGDDCQKPLPVPDSCPNSCNERWQQGMCTPSGCMCSSGYEGDDCSVPSVKFDGNNWDLIYCQNGARLYPPYSFSTPSSRNTISCLCPPGWEGLDCSICSSDETCNTPYSTESVCDRSFNIQKQKDYNCTVTSNSINELLEGVGRVTMECDLPETNCTMHMYVQDDTHGLVNLFNCQYIDVMFQNATVGWSYSACSCTTWCSDLVEDIVNGAQGPGSFTCDSQSSTCKFFQTELTFVFGTMPLVCDASECLSN